MGLLSSIGAIGGSIFGGPSGGSIGGLIGGMLDGNSETNGGAGATSSTQVKTPWGPAQPFLQKNLQTNQDLQDWYTQNPFSDLQKNSYNNLFNDSNNFRDNVMPGIMGVANSGMNGGGYHRQMGGRPGSGAGYSQPAVDTGRATPRAVNGQIQYTSGDGFSSNQPPAYTTGAGGSNGQSADPGQIDNAPMYSAQGGPSPFNPMDTVNQTYRDLQRTGTNGPNQGELNYWQKQAQDNGWDSGTLRNNMLQGAAAYVNDPKWGETAGVAKGLLAGGRPDQMDRINQIDFNGSNPFANNYMNTRNEQRTTAAATAAEDEKKRLAALQLAAQVQYGGGGGGFGGFGNGNGFTGDPRSLTGGLLGALLGQDPTNISVTDLSSYGGYGGGYGGMSGAMGGFGGGNGLGDSGRGAGGRDPG